jgi:shikimate kinase
MILDIILIGPIGTGKTTLSRLLAGKLGIPCVSLDERCWDYYREIGIDEAEDQNGPDGMFAWRFNVHAVERLLAEHRNCVLELGAGHSVYRESGALERIKIALAPYPNVFLILPCADHDEASRILEERCQTNPWLLSFRAEHGYDPNAHFLTHSSNYTLAKKIVYTQGRTPEQTRDEILALMAVKSGEVA